MLDQLQAIIEEYNLMGWGLGFIIAAITLTYVFKTIVGKWQWQKDKTPISRKKTIDDFRYE
jgi:hypothetical protein